jgi:hypothetical protein
VRPARARPYLVLLAVSFVLWYAGVRLRGGSGILDHSPIDQHTRQAQSWLAGRLDLPGAPAYLEIARYRDRFYDSFPPTPSLFELPLALVFGRQTPSSFILYLFWGGALCASYAVLRRRGFGERDAVVASLAFVFATNLYVSCSRANVWAQGLSLGYSLAVMGLPFVVQNRRTGGRGPGLGYLLLSLAVGARPLLLMMAPLYVALDRRTCARSLRQAVVSALLWMAPYGAFLAWLNWARFGDALEFGHRHLAFARDLPHGLMSPHYLPWHLYHAVVKLPRVQGGWPPLEFDMNGTAFWLHNPVLVAALWGLVARRFDPWIRGAAGFAFVTIGAGILMYESGGWVQFGFRYVIDLLPAGFVVFAFSFSRFPRLLLAASLVTFALTLYGLAGWKHFPRQPRDAPWLQDAPEAPPADLSGRAPTWRFRAVPPSRGA